MEHSIELNKLIETLNSIAVEYPTKNITPYHYLLSVTFDNKCLANRVLAATIGENRLVEISEFCITKLTGSTFVPKTSPDVEGFIASAIGNIKNSVIDSCDILISISRSNNDIYAKLEEISDNSVKRLAENKDKVLKELFKKKKVQKDSKSSETGEIERILPSLSKMAAEGNLPTAYGRENIISDIFNTLAKNERNNAIVVGEDGIGKTTTINHIANLLCSEEVPSPFIGKRMVLFDVLSLLVGTAARGILEAKIKTIIEEANRTNKYIIVIDDIHQLLRPNASISDISTAGLISQMLDNPNIMVIASATPNGYSNYITSNENLNSKFHKINMEPMSISETISLLNVSKLPLEKKHSVSIDEDTIELTVKLCERYIRDVKLPLSAIDLLDEVSAKHHLLHIKDEALAKLKSDRDSISNEIERLKLNSSSKEYDRVDELTNELIEANRKIEAYEKKQRNRRNASPIIPKEIHEAISQKVNVPVGEIDKDEVEKLKNLSAKMKSMVVGQDEAVDEVCRAVRRHRVGLSNPNKPVVFMAVGCTGTGKTYLAKKLSECVFGSEENMVRLDMSEYSDKISVNKLYGSAAGYVGYDEGGILTEAIKRKNRCVLLLDEIEKANEEVFNVLLQVFDDGQLTDNKGTKVNFKDVIIIMTSNVGARQVSDKANPIGFSRDNNAITDVEIIKKALKSKFNPEFLNRIDSVLVFNPLNEESLSKIIQIEIKKVVDRLHNIGYDADDSLYVGKLFSTIKENVSKESEYGARPILREIRRQMEDRITDLIIDKHLGKGYIFTDEDFC
jgi:ATP-dependent Clp protease ATP-binding subunit ClpC